MTLIAALGVLAPASALAQPPAADKPEAPKPAQVAPPSPQAQSQAEALAAKAFEAYGKGDYAGALALYREAAQVAPAAALYFNIANIYEKKLPDPDLAIEFYRKCVAATDATPDLTLKATARIQALNQEKQKAAAPAAPAPAPVPTAAPPPPVPAVVEDAGRPFKIAGGTLLGAGAVLVGVGIGFTVDAKSKLDTAHQTCTGNQCTSQVGVDAMNAASTSANAATWTVVLGSAMAASGVVLVVVGATKKGAPPSASTGLRLVPTAGPKGAGLTLTGAFF